MPLSHERSRVGRQVSGLTTPHRRPHHGVGMRQRGGMYERTICPCVAGANTSVSGTKTERAPNKMKNEKRWAPSRFERAGALQGTRRRNKLNQQRQQSQATSCEPRAANMRKDGETRVLSLGAGSITSLSPCRQQTTPSRQWGVRMISDLLENRGGAISTLHSVRTFSVRYVIRDETKKTPVAHSMNDMQGLPRVQNSSCVSGSKCRGT